MKGDWCRLKGSYFFSFPMTSESNPSNPSNGPGSSQNLLIISSFCIAALALIMFGVFRSNMVRNSSTNTDTNTDFDIGKRINELCESSTSHALLGYFTFTDRNNVLLLYSQFAKDSEALSELRGSDTFSKLVSGAYLKSKIREYATTNLTEEEILTEKFKTPMERCIEVLTEGFGQYKSSKDVKDRINNGL